MKIAGLAVRMVAVVALIAVTACGDSTDTKVDDKAVETPNDVTIHRDKWGVPHIYADREEHGFYGLGYAMANDQLVRFWLYVLAMRGELAQRIPPAALAGEPAGVMYPSRDAMLESDFQARLWRIREMSEPAVSKLDPQLRKNLQGFIDGLLAWQQHNPGQVPAWVPAELDLVDMVGISHHLLWASYQAGVGLEDCRRGGVQFFTLNDTRAEPASEQGYSNQWALMPSLTATGGAILLSDPHGGIDGRFTYEYRIHAGDFHSSGYSQGPLLILGRNKHLGWAYTTGAPDVSDCYRIEMKDGSETEYRVDGEFRSLEKRQFTIEVNGEAPITVEARYASLNGGLAPIVGKTDSAVYAVSTPYYQNMEGFHNATYGMNKARNVAEFQAAMDKGWIFPQNTLVADTSGDIKYIRAGMAPIRPDPDLDWLMPVDGNTPATEWQGIHPLSDLLIVTSPSQGYLTNNNIHPIFMDNPPLPELVGMPTYLLEDGYSSRESSNGRATRALQVLSATDSMTREQAFELTFDAVTWGYDNWLRMLAQAVDSKDAPAEGSDASDFLGDLLKFDGKLLAESTAALKYRYWREAVRNHLSTDHYETLREVFYARATLTDDIARALKMGLEEAAGKLAAAPNGLARKYGEEFRVAGDGGRTFQHSGGTLLTGFGPGAESFECTLDPLLCSSALLVAVHTPPDENSERVALGGSRIMRLDFYSAEGIESFSLQNPGISDLSDSPHSGDQAKKLLSQRTLKPVNFEWEDLEPNIVSTVKLSVDTPQ